MLEKSNQKAKADAIVRKGARPPLLRVALDRRSEGTFVCPACNNSVTKDLSKIARVQKAIQINCKCKCGHVYQVLVDRRSILREDVDFVGIFQYDIGGKSKKGLIKILDISMSGLQFSVNNSPDFKVGDRITVEFSLDDWERTKIREEGIVRWIHANKVGIQFNTVARFGRLSLYLLD